MAPAGGAGTSLGTTTQHPKKGAPMTTPRHRPESEPLLTPSEVATLFRVDPKTVTRWAKAGKLTSIRTLGGHRRYRESEVRSLLEGNTHATIDA
jgi:excisionase family DNA binding protein